MEAKAVVSARTSEGTRDGQLVVPARASGLSLLVAAVAETCSEKEAHIALGLPDAPYWSKVKSGDKPAPRVDRLTDLPEVTQREMCKRWGRQLGMRMSTEDAKAAAVADLIEVAARAVRELAS